MQVMTKKMMKSRLLLMMTTTMMLKFMMLIPREVDKIILKISLFMFKIVCKKLFQFSKIIVMNQVNSSKTARFWSENDLFSINLINQVSLLRLRLLILSN